MQLIVQWDMLKYAVMLSIQIANTVQINLLCILLAVSKLTVSVIKQLGIASSEKN